MIRPVAGVAGVPGTVMVNVADAGELTAKMPLYSGWSAPEISTRSLAV